MQSDIATRATPSLRDALGNRRYGGRRFGWLFPLGMPR
jgi:hypothetical protein